MSNLQAPWNYYFELQTELRDSTIVDDFSWGREAQLHRILASDDAPGTGELERVARSESRGERYRASLRRQYLSNGEGSVDGEAIMQARQELRLISGAVNDEEWSLLASIGEGAQYSEVAEASGVRTVALRVRVRRARRRLLALVA